MKKFILILASSLSMSCASCLTNYPKMDRDIKIYTGVPEHGTIERYKDGSDNVEAIRTDDPLFSKYDCETHSDSAYIQWYIEHLIESCKAWK